MEQERKALTRRFAQKDIEAWQKKANIECRGNLTVWIEDKLNDSEESLIERLKRMESKLDEVLQNYVEWED